MLTGVLSRWGNLDMDDKQHSVRVQAGDDRVQADEEDELDEHDVPAEAFQGSGDR